MQSNTISRMDHGLFVAVLALLFVGIVLVYSSSFAVAQRDFGGADFFLSRQVSRALLALVFFALFINIDYRVWSKYSGAIFAAAIILLVYVFLQPDTQAVKGAKRWVTLFGVRFQVSDFARIALVLFLAKKCGEKETDFGDWRSLIPHYVAIGIACALVVKEDLGTSLIMASTAFAMLFVAGAKITHLGVTALAALAFGVQQIASRKYRMDRLTGFFDFESQGSNLSYQVTQSLVGLGHGRLFGVGIGKGEQKYFFLPEAHTDFILSILGEEAGFMGIMLVFAVFAFIIWKGFVISLKAPDRTGRLLAFGLTTMLALYLLIHSGVATGLLPATGITMPFLSYGGMSLIFTMSGMGILLNISSRIDPQQVREEASARAHSTKRSQNRAHAQGRTRRRTV